jgi:phosphoglycerate kinase
LAHFGRPKGKPVPEMSLRHVVPALEDALGQPVTFVERSRPRGAGGAPAGSVVLVENTRFTPMETENDPKMAQFLASLGDIYCNDAFSAAHRAHASTEGVAHLLPSCAGRLMQAELTALEKALGASGAPGACRRGGRQGLHQARPPGQPVAKVDMLVIGGGMANTFLAAQGIDVAASLCEHDLGDTAREILAKAEARAAR